MAWIIKEKPTIFTISLHGLSKNYSRLLQQEQSNQYVQYFQANGILYKCQWGTFESPGVTLKTADIRSFPVVLNSSYNTTYFLKIQWNFKCCYIASNYHDSKPWLTFAAFHLMLLWRNPNYCLCWGLWVRFWALILLFPHLALWGPQPKECDHKNVVGGHLVPRAELRVCWLLLSLRGFLGVL